MLSKKFSDSSRFMAADKADLDDDDDEEEDAAAAGGGGGGRGKKYRNSRKKSLQKRNRMFEIVQRDLKQKDARLKQRKVVLNAGQRKGNDGDLYVDRDRAACVSFGKRDIKRQMRRSRYGNVGLGKPNDADGAEGLPQDIPHWEVFYKIGLYHTQRKGYERALANFSQAKDLEKTGTEPRIFLALCRCHLLLGDFRAALKDAECVFDMEDENASDPGFDEDGSVAAEAALMKAEALFQLGNFETSAIWFHRHGRARGGSVVCQADLQEMRAGVSKCKNAILNAFEEKKTTEEQIRRRGSKGIFAFPQLPKFVDSIHEEHGGDISKILEIEGGDHRSKRRVAGMSMSGHRRKVTTRKPNREGEEDCTVYASAKYGAPTGEKGGGVSGGGAGGGNGNFEQFLLKKRNLVANLTARFQAFTRGKGNSKEEDRWKRPKRKRDKNLCREMDKVVIARPISTDRKFLQSLADKDCSDIALEARYSSVIREALNFIDEREMFWKQHDARQPAARKSMRIAAAKV